MSTRISRKRDKFGFGALALLCAFVLFYSVSSLGANECSELIQKEFHYECQR